MSVILQARIRHRERIIARRGVAPINLNLRQPGKEFRHWAVETRLGWLSRGLLPPRKMPYELVSEEYLQKLKRL